MKLCNARGKKWFRPRGTLTLQTQNMPVVQLELTEPSHWEIVTSTKVKVDRVLCSFSLMEGNERQCSGVVDNRMEKESVEFS